jgi:hypothetical protein
MILLGRHCQPPEKQAAKTKLNPTLMSLSGSLGFDDAVSTRCIVDLSKQAVQAHLGQTRRDVDPDQLTVSRDGARTPERLAPRCNRHRSSVEACACSGLRTKPMRA